MLLFVACNNVSTKIVQGNDIFEENKIIDYRRATIDEAIKTVFDYTVISTEYLAFRHDNKEEILKTLRIVDTREFKGKYFFVFIDFSVGSTVYREVINIVKMFDGNYIQSFTFCYEIDCPDELDDKIDEWKKGSTVLDALKN